MRIAALVFAGVFVAIADALIKRIADDAAASRPVLANPLLIAVVLLYMGQVAFFLYVFVKRMELGIAGILQMLAYAASTVLLSMLYFRERLTLAQLAGIVLAVIGSMLMLKTS